MLRGWFYSRYVLYAFILLLLSACSSLNGTRLEPVLGGHINLVKLGDDIAEELVIQSFPPVLPRQMEQPVLVTTLVDNNDLQKTTAFGRSLQDAILGGFVQRGYAAKELKLRPEVVVQEQRGEFMLSRELSKIAQRQRAQAVVVGTYTLANRMLYLSVRLVSPQDRAIRSTFEDRLYLDEYSLLLFNKKFVDKAETEDTVVQPPRESYLDKIFY
ncbi:MAG: hypothetical protein CSA32_02510 [Desulfobulbus propionicus]|nr:MAG: hypothetical protein CSA32_02510 [Desulfobulbus propionicus]